MEVALAAAGACLGYGCQFTVGLVKGRWPSHGSPRRWAHQLCTGLCVFMSAAAVCKQAFCAGAPWLLTGRERKVSRQQKLRGRPHQPALEAVFFLVASDGLQVDSFSPSLFQAAFVVVARKGESGGDSPRTRLDLCISKKKKKT